MLIVTPDLAAGRRQPRFPAAIPGLPLADKLLFAAIPGDVSIFGSAAQAVLSGSFTRAVGREGRCAKAPASQTTGYAGYATNLSLPASQDYTIAALCIPSGDATNGTTPTQDFVGAQTNFLSVGSNGFRATLDNNGTALNAWTDTSPALFMATRKGGTVSAYVPSGVAVTAATGTRAQTFTTVAAGRYSGNNMISTETYLIMIWARALALAEYLALGKNPWQMFWPWPRRIWIPDASSGAADLVLQNCAHAHNADALALSSAHALIASASAHAHTAANLALSSTMGLSVSPAAHAHTADAPTLSAALFLLIQNTLHAHAAGNVTLDNTGAAVLAIADALHAHAANPLAISQAVTLAVANALHPHTADAPTLQTLVSLMIAHAQHGHAADNIAFGIAVIELVQDLMLDALYQAGDFGLAVDCLLGTAAFTAFLDTADDDYFAAQSTGHTLRYRLGVPLQTGDQVTIDGTLYRVNGAPRQINSGEMRAALVRVPS